MISEGAYYGMQTFDQALLHHVQAGRAAMDDVPKASTHLHDFKLLVSPDGQRHTSRSKRCSAARKRPRRSQRLASDS